MTILLTPGPLNTTKSVKNAQVQADICPREEELAALMQDCSKQLLTLANNPKNMTPIYIGGSGTAATESILSSVPTGTVIVIENGAYGERISEILNTYQSTILRYKSDSTLVLDVQKLAKFIEEKKATHNITHIAMVHHETSTGILNPLTEIAALAKAHNIQLIVDAISSFGAIPVDCVNTPIDYMSISSNKNLQGLPGISIILANTERLDELKDLPRRSYYLSLYDQYIYQSQHQQFRFTPPTTILYALKQALTETLDEGLENRYTRYKTNWKTLIDGMNTLGFEHYVADNAHGKLITAFKDTLPQSFQTTHQQLKNLGYSIYPGKDKALNSFRIANIGNIHPSDITNFLSVFKQTL